MEKAPLRLVITTDGISEIVTCPECDQPAGLVALNVTERILLLRCRPCRVRFTRELTVTQTTELEILLEARRPPAKRLPEPKHACAGGCGRMIGLHVTACWRCRTKP